MKVLDISFKYFNPSRSFFNPTANLLTEVCSIYQPPKTTGESRPDIYRPVRGHSMNILGGGQLPEAMEFLQFSGFKIDPKHMKNVN